MATKCVASNCLKEQGMFDEYGEEILFHQFPWNNYERLEKWIVAVKRTNEWQPNQYSFICSLHFKPKDYIKILKDDAVPSIFYSEQNEIEYMDTKQEVKNKEEESTTDYFIHTDHVNHLENHNIGHCEIKYDSFFENGVDSNVNNEVDSNLNGDNSHCESVENEFESKEEIDSELNSSFKEKTTVTTVNQRYDKFSYPHVQSVKQEIEHNVPSTSTKVQSSGQLQLMAEKQRTSAHKNIETRREQKRLSMRRAIEKIRNNPELYEEVNTEAREYCRKLKAKGKIKGIAELSPREQNIEKRREQKRLSMRRARERIKDNPELYEERKAKAREYWRKLKAEGKIKGIAELNRREQIALREDWRQRHARRRDRIKGHDK